MGKSNKNKKDNVNKKENENKKIEVKEIKTETKAEIKNEAKKELKKEKEKKEKKEKKTEEKKVAVKETKKVEKSDKSDNKDKNKEDKKIKKEKKEKIEKKDKKDKKDKKVKKENKEGKTNKFLEFFKQKWLVNGTTTFLLIAIIIMIFIGVNLILTKMELTPIDLTQEKLYTLTEESKNKVSGIDKDVKILFINFQEEDLNIGLAKQYNKANEKITVEVVDANARPDVVEKYGAQSGMQIIAVECGERTKIISPQDLVSYDSSTGESSSIVEKRLTSTILSVASDVVPKVYFLEGYSEYALNSNMNLLASYLSNEIFEVEKLRIMSFDKIPDDCSALVITTPNRDFDPIVTDAIINYIQSGKDILWLNAASSNQVDMPNVNKILAMYGVQPFESGNIIETDSSRMLADYPNIIDTLISYSPITRDMVNTSKVYLMNATKINVDEEKLEDLNVEKRNILTSANTVFFRKEYKDSFVPEENEEKNAYLLGAEFEKLVKPAEGDAQPVKSKLVLYAENLFVSDVMVGNRVPAIMLGNGKDLIINSIAYLADRPEDITVRKDMGIVPYSATESQDLIVKIIIFTIPVLIVIAGIVVWQVRRRKK